MRLVVSSGFKSPSKGTHNEWLDTTRTTFRNGKVGYGLLEVLAPRCQKAPEAVQHLCAKRFRRVQNYPTLLPKGSWEKSSEAKPGLKKAIPTMTTSPFEIRGIP
uniref:Transposase n=1 Tax=Heterorhabditis bacteriophora TaxID=37862 RepID=A0A1I7WD54_HETBA